MTEEENQVEEESLENLVGKPIKFDTVSNSKEAIKFYRVFAGILKKVDDTSVEVTHVVAAGGRDRYGYCSFEQIGESITYDRSDVIDVRANGAVERLPEGHLGLYNHAEGKMIERAYDVDVEEYFRQLESSTSP